MIENLSKSTKYVRGENEASIFPHKGKSFRGMNTPLTNINGNFMSVEIVITFAGISVGEADSNAPKQEKQSADINIPNAAIRG